MWAPEGSGKELGRNILWITGLKYLIRVKWSKKIRRNRNCAKSSKNRLLQYAGLAVKMSLWGYGTEQFVLGEVAGDVQVRVLLGQRVQLFAGEPGQCQAGRNAPDNAILGQAREGAQ